MAMLPFSTSASSPYLIATRTNGLFKYDGVSIDRMETEIDSILIRDQIYCGARLPNGQFALGTIQNGVVILDSAGVLQHHLNKKNGLQDETVWFVYPDREGGLWIAMHIGMSRAEIGSAYTHFASPEGVEGSVLGIIRHEGTLYITSSMGTYYLDERPGAPHAPGRFLPVSDVSPQGWALLSLKDALIAATFEGVYEITGDKGRLVDRAYAMSLHGSKQDARRVFVGLQQGLKTLYTTGAVGSTKGVLLHWTMRSAR
jgi:hypothetical protein